MESKWPAGFRALLIVAAIAVLLLVGRAWAATEADDGGSDATTDVQAPADDGGGAKSKEVEKPRRPWRRRRQWTGPRVPEGVKAFGDLEYAKVGERPLLLDLYVPEKAEGPLPLVVWVHGGGWRAGNKRFCRALPMTRRGYAVASIGYRLSGEAPMPAQIYDCKAAVRWLRAKAGKYNIDPKRIGAWGASAGGHLVALMGTSGGLKDLEGDLGNADQSSRVQAVCDFFGPSDLISIFERASRPAASRRPVGARCSNCWEAPSARSANWPEPPARSAM
ncbi:MAG: alpha/beta hydrolase fold domain-containing protein [Anaerolineaceae bacterium]|nr:alpha/beta hydrolase fold domain-containing protein [Anaerolineaceae bacterium]